MRAKVVQENGNLSLRTMMSDEESLWVVELESESFGSILNADLEERKTIIENLLAKAWINNV